MTYSFGLSSRGKLNTVHHDLAAVAVKVMEWQIYDFAIVWGYRDKDAQNQAVLSGNSKAKWPLSKHNKNPSLALDFAPWVDGAIPWNDTHAFALIGGLFLAAGAELGIGVRFGGDWDRDGATTDQALMDWGHVELML